MAAHWEAEDGYTLPNYANEGEYLTLPGTEDDYPEPRRFPDNRLKTQTAAPIGTTRDARVVLPNRNKKENSGILKAFAGMALVLISLNLIISIVHFTLNCDPNAIDQSRSHASRDACVVAAGTALGSPFDDYSLYVSNGNITALELNEQEIDNKLTGIRVRYGSVFTQWRGVLDGTVQQLSLENGETIISLMVYVGNVLEHRGVIGLHLVTNRRNISSKYGTTSRDVSSMVDATWDELLYFSGTAGGVLDQLVAHARGCHSVKSVLV